MGKFKFDVAIGNPPYQEDTDSDSTRMPPIYNIFMDEAYKCAEKVELITPARFLFNAGYTPKDWNEKMLNDKHFKIIHYEPVSAKVFANTDIKGGVTVSYRDESKDFGAIGIFTKYDELNSILQKVRAISTESLASIISSPLSYGLTERMKKDHPDLLPRLRTSAFTNLADIFFDEQPNDGNTYIQMVGLLKGKRVRKYVRKDYISDGSGTLDKYTFLLSKANGAGTFGEKLAEGLIAEPGAGYTQTFIGIGAFDNADEASNVNKYIHTKFARAMLGVLKITQDCPGPKWLYVPLQEFTSSSDIDWSQSIRSIDQQLYKKYGLDEKEISFIEKNVKEMA